LAERLQAAWLERGGLAIALWPVALGVALAADVNRWLYARGLLKVQRAAVPVVVVGNLVAGGAGKTPTVLALVRALQARGEQPGIVSRGHGRQGSAPMLVEDDTPVGSAGDEPLLLRRLSGVPVAVGRDRPAAVAALLKAQPRLSVVVSDDGLQHHRLARDAELVVFDERGIGNGWCLPAGPLRERWRARPRDGWQVVYNAAKPTTAWPGTLVERRLRGAVRLDAWQRGEAATPQALLALRERRVLAAAGVAFPDRFFEMLRAAGLAIVPCPLPDHHPFDTLPWAAHTADVILTEKDAVKLDPARMGDTRVWVAPLDLALPESVVDAVLAQVQRFRAQRSAAGGA
jgi:tetraacyldisaccharide 4'-kinase